MEYEQRVQDAIRKMIAEGLAESAHDLSDGGLAVALAECSFGPRGDRRADRSRMRSAAGGAGCFTKAPSRILISTADPKRVAAIAENIEVEAPVVGVTMKRGSKSGSAT